MSLCSYCLKLYDYEAESNDNEKFVHHPSLAALQASSAHCPLCSAMLSVFTIKQGQDVVDTELDYVLGPDDPPITAWRQSRGLTFLVPQLGKLQHSKSTRRPSTVLLCPSNSGLSKLPIWNSQLPLTRDERLVRISSWLESCMNNHPRCSTTSEFLPRRLINVGDGDEGGVGPRLVIREEIRLIHQTIQNRSVDASEMNDSSISNIQKRTTPNFATLSHCWGTRPDTLLKTKRENFQDHLEGLPIDRLSTTFKDALEITRGLGIKYLWIDSICIIQDDEDDWHAQCVEMSSIYENSVLTIAATASKDGSGGCIQPLGLSRHIPDPSGAKVSFYARPESPHEVLVDAPLTSRGWTLQETTISPRIVQCAADQLHWVCRTREVDEDGFKDTSRNPQVNMHHMAWKSLFEYQPELSMANVGWMEMISQNPNIFDVRDLWWTWAASYCCRHLSFQQDKFAAVAGITKFFTNKTGWTPLAGLWQELLPIDLLWAVNKPQKLRKVERIPSWSWMAFDGPIQGNLYIYGGSLHISVSVLSTKIEWSNAPLTSMITSGAIGMSARIFPASIDLLVNTGSRDNDCKYRIEAKDIQQECFSGFVEFDIAPPAGIGSVKCMDIHQSQTTERSIVEVRALVVEQVEPGSKEYRRIGITNLTTNPGYFPEIPVRFCAEFSGIVKLV